MMYTKFHANPSTEAELTRGNTRRTDIHTDTQTFILIGFLAFSENSELNFRLFSFFQKVRIFAGNNINFRTQVCKQI